MKGTGVRYTKHLNRILNTRHQTYAFLTCKCYKVKTGHHTLNNWRSYTDHHSKHNKLSQKHVPHCQMKTSTYAWEPALVGIVKQAGLGWVGMVSVPCTDFSRVYVVKVAQNIKHVWYSQIGWCHSLSLCTSCTMTFNNYNELVQATNDGKKS